jgi:hypothetical protein
MKIQKMLCLILSLTMLFIFSACKNNINNDVNPGGNEMEYELEKDYVYMWHKDGLNGDTRNMCIQTENYNFLIDSKNSKIIGAGINQGNNFTEYELNSLKDVESTFSLKIDGTYHSSLDLPTSSRIIDSGRNVNRLDNISMRYPTQGTSKYGRVEYVATKTHMAINYELFSTTAGIFDMVFSLTIADSSASEILNGRCVKVIDNNGNGFAYLKQNANSQINFIIQGNTVNFEYLNVNIQSNKFIGYGIIVVPIKNNSLEEVNKFLSLENLEISANSSNGQNLPTIFDSSDGVFYIDTDSISIGAQNISVNRTALEKVIFSINNKTQFDLKPTLCFTKNSSNYSITGMSPVIRDYDSYEPTGEQVQISKNWHAFSSNESDFNYASENDPKKLYSGPWYHGYVNLKIEKEKSLEREYVCAYGNWGNVYSASHAQLCLIGWGGNQVWDQSALGSWGESVTYDPDIGLNRSMIDDVRPFLCKGPSGQNQEYDWSGNVGGADFLNYIEESEQRIINQKITYITQAPNVTNVNYSGITANGKIASSITINMGRTDDIVRNYYTIKYEFLEDVDYGRLSLFKIAADGYSDNKYNKYAYGDINGITEKDKNAASVNAGYDNGQTKNATESNFWYAMYNSTNMDENGDIMFTVRSFNANLNGVTYTKPAYNFFGTTNQNTQMSCEITVPTQVGKIIKKGSVIEMIVEYSIVPNNIETYYGLSDYILQTTDLMGTADSMYQQVLGGAVVAKASVGTILSDYPVIIDAKGNSETVAEFTINGGLGYVPVMINNLDTYKNWQLQVKVNSKWENIDQSKNGNDYWQTYHNSNTGKYQLSYNVKNTEGLSFNTTKEYRLIKK